MPPVICIVGKKGAGKTSLLERLVAELKQRRYRVATIKHDVHGFDLDLPGKDSWRHAQAGSEAVIISSPQKLALIKKLEHEATLDELVRFLGDFDIVLAEGFKHSQAPKIEVHRKELEGELLSSPLELIAIATDETLDTPIPQYPLDNAPGLADLIEERLLAHREQEETVLFANGAPVPLNPFVSSLINKILLAMVSALRGVENVKSLDVSLRRKAKDDS